MAPPKKAAATIYQSAEEFSYADNPRTFKSPAYGAKANKRNKNLKQIIAAEKEREKLKLAENPTAELVTYSSVEAPPSILPAKKYCDITGLPAPYVDPRSMLRYHNAEVYDVIKTFQPSVTQAYLAVRGSGVVLR